MMHHLHRAHRHARHAIGYLAERHPLVTSALALVGVVGVYELVKGKGPSPAPVAGIATAGEDAAAALEAL